MAIKDVFTWWRKLPATEVMPTNETGVEEEFRVGPEEDFQEENPPEVSTGKSEVGGSEVEMGVSVGEELDAQLLTGLDFDEKDGIKWAKIGFHHALSVDRPDEQQLKALVDRETAPLKQRLSIAQQLHTQSDNSVKQEVARIEGEISAYDTQIHQAPVDTAVLEDEVKGLRLGETELVDDISELRQTLMEARGKIVREGTGPQFEGLQNTLKGVKESNDAHWGLNTQAHTDRKEWYDHRNGSLAKEYAQVEARRDDVHGTLAAYRFVTGAHIQIKLTIANALACLAGWAMAILAGATKFDDDTILEVFVQQILKAVTLWQGEKGFWGRIVFFIGWVLLYFLCLGITIVAQRMVRWAESKRGGEESGSGKEYEETNPELEVELEPDSFRWMQNFGPDLIKALAPAWVLLGVLLIFVTSGSVTKLASAENAYSGFLVGFAGAWVMGLVGYFLFFQGEGQKRGLMGPVLWILGAISVGSLIFLLGDRVAGATKEVSMSAGVFGAILVVAMGLIGKILQVFLLVREERELNQRMNRIAVAQSRFMTPWSTMLEYGSAKWMRRHLLRLEESFGQIQHEWLNTMRLGRWGISDHGRPVFYDKVLPEYQAHDHVNAAEIVGKIETKKRTLLEVRSKIAGLEEDIRAVRAQSEGWQQDLRKRIGALVNSVEAKRKTARHQTLVWMQTETNALRRISFIEAQLRRGYESGRWYKENGHKINEN